MSVATPPLRIPYPGLRPFEAADQPVFFGRESQISAILRQLEDDRFVAVVGSSGSGKSSLVRAGLLPALREGFLFGATNWAYPFPIIKPGNAPYEHLATKLCQLEDTLQRPALGGIEGDKKALFVDKALTLATLQKSERGLMNAIRDVGLPESRPVMVVVDQFEEIFAFRRATGTDRQEVASRDETAAFVNMLLRSCADPESRIWVVLTMRSDFIGNCEAFLGLPEAVSRSQFLVPRLDRKQMEEAITRPGEVKIGAFQPFSFQQDLVNRIVNDAGDRPDQLPMMQHALMRTWKRAAGLNTKDGKLTLTLEDYQQVGGIEEALSKDADEAWDKIKADSKNAEIARRLFLLLCDVSPDGQITRRRPQVEEVMAVTSASAVDVERVMWEFQKDDRNFLLPPHDESLTPDKYLDVSHETLLRRWHLFSQWLRGEREAVAELRRLVDRMKGGALLQAKELDRITQWQQENSPSPQWVKRYVTENEWNEAQVFVARSAEDVQQRQKAEKKREEQRARLKRNVVLIVLGTLLVAFGVSLFFMLRAQDAAQAARQALTISFLRTIGVSKDAIPTRDERESLWELAQLDRANKAVRDNMLKGWFRTPEAFMRGEARGGQGFQAATGLNLEYHPLVISGAAKLGQRIAAALENADSYDLPSLGNALAALTAKMEPQTAAEIAKQGAQRIAAALKKTQVTDPYNPPSLGNDLSSLGNALAALAAKMEPQVAAEIAKQGAQCIAAALEKTQDSYNLSSLGNALAALAAKMEPQAAAEVAKQGAQRIVAALEKMQVTDSYNLLSVGNAVAALAAKMEPQAAAEIERQLVQRIVAALEKMQVTDSYNLLSVGNAVAALAAKMEPQAAAEIAKQGAQRIAAALEKTQVANFYNPPSLGSVLAALAAKMESQAAAEIAKGLATALENSQETNFNRLSSLDSAVAALAAKMKPQAAAEIAKGLATALENPQEMNRDRLSSLDSAVAALAAKMEPQAAAGIAKGLAAALENPQETNRDRLSSLDSAVAALAATMEPQAAPGIAQGLAVALENPQETNFNRVSSLGSALAALAAKMEPQAAAEIAKQGAQRIAAALENADSYDLPSLGSALAALAAKMEPQAAAEIAKQGAQRIAAALENADSYDLPSLGNALAALAAKMKPQAAAEIAKQGAQRIAAALEKTQVTDSYNLSSLGDTLAALAAKMEPQAAAEIERQVAQRIAAALEKTQVTDSYKLLSLGDTLVALAAKMEPQAAAEIERQVAQRIAAALEKMQATGPYKLPSFGNALAAAEIAKGLTKALDNPQETDSNRLLNLGRTLAAFCPLLPSAHHTQQLALSNLLLAPVPKMEDEDKEQSNDRKLLVAMCAQLGPQDLAEVLKYPFCTGEAREIVLKELQAQTGRKFGGDVWNFAEQTDSLGVKDVSSPAKRPSVRGALNELDKITRQ